MYEENISYEGNVSCIRFNKFIWVETKIIDNSQNLLCGVPLLVSYCKCRGQKLFLENFSLVCLLLLWCFPGQCGRAGLLGMTTTNKGNKALKVSELTSGGAKNQSFFQSGLVWPVPHISELKISICVLSSIVLQITAFKHQWSTLVWQTGFCASLSVSSLTLWDLLFPVFCRWSVSQARMAPVSQMESWWPCRCGSSTSIFVGSPKRRSCSSSSGGAPWRTGAMPPAAG